MSVRTVDAKGWMNLTAVNRNYSASTPLDGAYCSPTCLITKAHDAEMRREEFAFYLHNAPSLSREEFWSGVHDAADQPANG